MANGRNQERAGQLVKGKTTIGEGLHLACSIALIGNTILEEMDKTIRGDIEKLKKQGNYKKAKKLEKEWEKCLMKKE